MANSLHHKRMDFVARQILDKSFSSQTKEASLRAIKGLGVVLRTQGLMVALATLGGNNDTRWLAQLLGRWLTDHMPRPLLKQEALEGHRISSLLKALSEADRVTYQAAQREALAVAELMKIYAEAWGPQDNGRG